MSRPAAHARVFVLVGLAALFGGAGVGCQILPQNATLPTVSLRMKGNVAEAQVTVDDIALGPLGYVAAHGVALPVGEHRVTVEHGGYFPWDRLVKAEKDPISLEVVMVPIPD